MSKWVSIWIHDNFIEMPITFDTYAEAYDDMLDDFSRLSIGSIKSEISDMYAYIENDEHYIAWRLYEVKF
jgi:hypothetical protein